MPPDTDTDDSHADDTDAGDSHADDTDAGDTHADDTHADDTEATAELVFAALSDPSRRAILATLASGGPATATDLADGLPISRQAIAKHLALLAETDLVVAAPGERRRVRYRLNSAPIHIAQQFLAALARDWDHSLDALGQYLDRAATTPAKTKGRARHA